MPLTKKHVYAPLPKTERGKFVVINGHTESKYLAFGTQQGVVLRSLEDPLQVTLYQEHAKAATAACISPSGGWVASGDVSGAVRVWPVKPNEDGEHLIKFEGQPLAAAISDIRWSPDNQRVAVCGDGREQFGHVFMWDAGSSVGSISGHSKKINAIDFRPVRPFRIVTGSEDKQVNFFEGPPFKFKCSIKEHDNFVNCVRYSPNGEFFVSVSNDKKAIVYEGKTGEKKGELVGHRGTIYWAAWSPDSSMIATCSADKTVRVWKWSGESGESIAEFTFAEKPTADHMQVSVAWVADTLVSYSLGGQLSFLDVASGGGSPVDTWFAHTTSVSAVGTINGGAFFVSVDTNGKALVWDAMTGRAKPVPGAPELTTSIAAAGTSFAIASRNDAILMGNSADGEAKVHTSVSAGSAVHTVAISANGSSIAGLSSAAIVLVQNGQVAASLNVQSCSWTPKSIAISPDGTTVAVGASDNNVYLLEAEGSSLAVKKTLSGHRSDVSCVSFSPDGEKIASGDGNREVIAFSVASGERLVSGWVYHASRISCVAWAPDSDSLASGSVDSYIIVWSLRNPKSNIRLQGTHRGGVQALSWINESEIVSGGVDAALKTWIVDRS